MKTTEIQEKINAGYEIIVCLQPTKKHDKVTLKTYLQKEGESIVFPIYYNHCKNLLNKDQIRLIELYNEVKNWQFKDRMEFNINYKKDPTNKELNEIYFVQRAINRIEYLAQN